MNARREAFLSWITSESIKTGEDKIIYDSLYEPKFSFFRLYRNFIRRYGANFE